MVPRSRPPKDQPWYHVLVNNSIHQTYVAEHNIESIEEPKPISHPLLGHYFKGIADRFYQLRIQKN